jgi:hypothetical protein
LYAGYLSWRFMLLRILLRQEFAALTRQRFDLVAKTWCFGAQRPADGRDFYYGDLQQKLARRGIRMLLLCGDPMGVEWRAFGRGQVSTGPLCRLPELALVHPLRPVQTMLKQLLTSWRLCRLSSVTCDLLVRAISRRASLDCLSPRVTRECLLYWVGLAATRAWRPRTFLTLYEGHGWERCAWRGVKAAGVACQIAAYQHTVVFRESLTLTEPPVNGHADALPDLVLCLGQVPLDLLRNGHERYGVRMLQFGSFRSRGGVAEHPVSPARRTVLVTPEGIASEVEILFSFAYACAQRMPSYTFILRSHPELPIARALQFAPPGLMRQHNVMISTHQSIEDDFARASVLMYRGSSTVMYAIMKGLLPLYVHVAGTLDTDSVYALEGWRKRCTTPEELAEIVEAYERMDDQQMEAEWRQAARYVAEYISPVSDEHLDTFVSVAGLHADEKPCAA